MRTTLAVLFAGLLVVVGLCLFLIPSFGDMKEPDWGKVAPQDRAEVTRLWAYYQRRKAEIDEERKCNPLSWFGLVGKNECPRQQ
jgi:hypothetical protein